MCHQLRSHDIIKMLHQWQQPTKTTTYVMGKIALGEATCHLAIYVQLLNVIPQVFPQDSSEEHWSVCLPSLSYSALGLPLVIGMIPMYQMPAHLPCQC